MNSKDVDAALKLRLAIANWQSLYPDHTDMQACETSALVAKKFLGLGQTTLAGKVCPSAHRANPKAISEQRKALPSGAALPLKERIRLVLGGDSCKVSIILSRLKARGWEPHAQDPNTYLSKVLSQSPLFERVRLGVYRRCL